MTAQLTKRDVVATNALVPLEGRLKMPLAPAAALYLTDGSDDSLSGGASSLGGSLSGLITRPAPRMPPAATVPSPAPPLSAPAPTPASERVCLPAPLLRPGFRPAPRPGQPGGRPACAPEDAGEPRVTDNQPKGPSRPEALACAPIPARAPTSSGSHRAGPLTAPPPGPPTPPPRRAPPPLPAGGQAGGQATPSSGPLLAAARLSDQVASARAALQRQDACRIDPDPCLTASAAAELELECACRDCRSS